MKDFRTNAQRLSGMDKRIQPENVVNDSDAHAKSQAAKTEREREISKARRTNDWYFFMSPEEKAQVDKDKAVWAYYQKNDCMKLEHAIEKSGLDQKTFEDRRQILGIKTCLVKDGNYRNEYILPLAVRAIATFSNYSEPTIHVPLNINNIPIAQKDKAKFKAQKMQSEFEKKMQIIKDKNGTPRIEPKGEKSELTKFLEKYKK